MSRDDLRSLEEILTQQAPLRPVRFSHVVLRTPDLEPMRNWYLRVLNAQIAFEHSTVCFMTYDQEHHRIGIVQVPDAARAGEPTNGLDHISFTYATLGELLANYRRLRNEGIEPYWPINHGPTVSMYYRDPDGNRVELQFDIFASAAGANDFIARYYTENFMGIIFDPEEIIARFEAGVSLAELTRRPSLPAGMNPWDMYRP